MVKATSNHIGGLNQCSIQTSTFRFRKLSKPAGGVASSTPPFQVIEGLREPPRVPRGEIFRVTCLRVLYIYGIQPGLDARDRTLGRGC